MGCLQPMKPFRNSYDSVPQSLFLATCPKVQSNPYNSCHLNLLLRKNVLNYVSQFCKYLNHAKSLAKEFLSTSQTVIKHQYDCSTIPRHFQEGDKVLDAEPIKQHPYCVNPVKCVLMKNEAEYLLQHGLAKPISSP